MDCNISFPFQTLIVCFEIMIDLDSIDLSTQTNGLEIRFKNAAMNVLFNTKFQVALAAAWISRRIEVKKHFAYHRNTICE